MKYPQKNTKSIIKKSIINAFLLFIVCSPNTSTAQTIEKSVGYASYYHDKFVGRKTASGQIYRHEKMTCAHRTLPFGTVLKVTNLTNKKSVIVTVNDRGPFVSDRIVDLSKAAAQKLDFIKLGEVKVKIALAADIPKDDTLATDTIITADSELFVVQPIDTIAGTFTIQIGAYKSDKEIFTNVGKVKEQLDRQVIVEKVTTDDGVLYRMFVGTFTNRLDADEYLLRIKTFYPGCFVVEIKGK